MPKLTEKYLKDTKEYSMNLLKDIQAILIPSNTLPAISSRDLVCILKKPLSRYKTIQNYDNLTVTSLAIHLRRFNIKPQFFGPKKRRHYLLKDFEEANRKYLVPIMPRICLNEKPSQEFNVWQDDCTKGRVVVPISEHISSEDLLKSIEEDMEITMKCKDAINDVLESLQSLGKEMKFIKDSLFSIGGVMAVTIIIIIFINIFSK